MLDNQDLMEASNASTEKQNIASLSAIEKFPMKLHKIVERHEIDGCSGIISWMPHGRNFKTHNRNEFFTKVMPKHVYITRLTSFIRQLALHGFYKCRNGADKGSFFHKLFLCGRPGLCIGITRSSEKKLKLEFEPNFYKMPYSPRISAESSTKYDSFGIDALPDRPRTVQYQTSNENITSDKTIPKEMNNVSLSDSTDESARESSSSFEYFQKSHQLIAKNLFSIFDSEERKTTLPTNRPVNLVKNSIYSSAA